MCQTFLDLLVCLNLISMAVNKIKFKTVSETLKSIATDDPLQMQLQRSIKKIREKKELQRTYDL